MSWQQQRLLSAGLLAWLLMTITIGLQSWIGDATIYSKGLEQPREEFHFAILANKAPGGAGWAAVGALSIQKRVGVVYLAEAIRKITDLRVGKIYKLLDTVFLFASLVGLYFLLRNWLVPVYSLIGVLYFSAVLPLTYFFQLFHPWDRLQLLIWIVLLYLILTGRYYWLVAALFLSIFVKFDTILAPFLYFMVHISRSRYRLVAQQTLGLIFIAVGAYMWVGYLFPAPLDNSRFTIDVAKAVLSENLVAFISMNVKYPPLLVHLLPGILALMYMRSKDQFVVGSVVFAFGLTLIYALFTRYEEVRTHLIVLVLILPSALISLKKLLESNCSFDSAR